MQPLKPIPQVYVDILSGSDFSNSVLDISSSLTEEYSLGDIPKGFQTLVINSSIFSGSSFNIPTGSNSAIVYNSSNNSGSVNYSFTTSPTSSYCFELFPYEALNLSSLEQIQSIKFYNPNNVSYSVNLIVEFFS